MELIDGKARVICDRNGNTKIELRVTGMDGVVETCLHQFALTPYAHNALEQGLRQAREERERREVSAEVIPIGKLA